MGKQKIIKTGNSLAVTIPSGFVKAIGVRSGQVVRVRIELEKGQIIYSFSGSRQLPLPATEERKKKLIPRSKR